MSKKKSEIKLRLDEILVLNKEVSTMLQEPEVSFTTKYYLAQLLEETKKYVQPFNKMKLDIFKKYGEPDKERPGFYTLNSVSHEVYVKAQNEIDKLIEQEEVIQSHAFKMAEFEDLKSSNGYVYIFQFIEL